MGILVVNPPTGSWGYSWKVTFAQREIRDFPTGKGFPNWKVGHQQLESWALVSAINCKWVSNLFWILGCKHDQLFWSQATWINIPQTDSTLHIHLSSFISYCAQIALFSNQHQPTNQFPPNQPIPSQPTNQFPPWILSPNPNVSPCNFFNQHAPKDLIGVCVCVLSGKGWIHPIQYLQSYYHRIHVIMVYLPTFSIKINHSCS